MSNSFKSVEKKYFVFSRTIRFVITVLYPIMFLIAPIEYKFLLPFIWLLLFLGGEWLQEIYLHRIIVVGFYIVHRIEDAIWNSYVISMYWPVAMFQRVQVMTVAEWFSVVAAIFVIHGVLLTCIGIIIMKKRDIK